MDGDRRYLHWDLDDGCGFGVNLFMGHMLTFFITYCFTFDILWAISSAILILFATAPVTYFALRRWGLDPWIRSSPFMFWPMLMPLLPLFVPALERERRSRIAREVMET